MVVVAIALIQRVGRGSTTATPPMMILMMMNLMMVMAAPCCRGGVLGRLLGPGWSGRPPGALWRPPRVLGLFGEALGRF